MPRQLRQFTLADDEIVAAGYRSAGSAVTFALARYFDGGTLNPTFGNNGKGGSCWGVVKVGVPRGARSAIDSAPPSFNSFGP